MAWLMGSDTRLAEGAKLFASAPTAERVIIISLALLLLLVVTSILKRWLQERTIRRLGMDPGKAQAIFTVLHYLAIVLGTLAILRVGGVDLASLAVLAGALSLGVGFGLQTIVHNFVSGIIILIERPIKVGDRIELQHITGRVVKISFRSTLVVTNDNISVIIPNADIISATVINWTQTDRSVRFSVPIGVSYTADPRQVIDLLMKAAHLHPGVLDEPAPDVLLEQFGDSSLDFQLRVWTQTYTDRPGVLRSELNLAIHALLKEHGIEIPFPQRVVHLQPSPSKPQD